MPWTATIRRLSAGAFVGGILILAHATPTVADAAAEAHLAGFENGEAGFVISSIRWGLGPDAAESGACPNGMASTPGDAYQASAEGRRREGETDQAYAARIRLATAPPPNSPNACAFPQERGPDPNYRTVSGANVKVHGIDLDGVDSKPGAGDKAGTCAHEDFLGLNGERGVDNQFYRLVGCTTGFQSTGGKLTFGREMLTGAWGILIKLKNVDSLVNDNHVEVGIHANADPIQLSPARTALSHATYVIDPDPRFQARTRGRIVNGVLTTEPVNVRFHSVTNNIHLERPIDDARLRVTFNKDGSIEGIMAGYADVDEFYDFVVGYRSGKTRDGKPAPENLRTGSAGGSSSSAGFTCNGIYHAMKQLADGKRDPRTGACSALSHQYLIKAVPAFVVDRAGQGRLARTTD